MSTIPSDTVISTTIFNGENYDDWADSVINGLSSENKLQIIDGTIAKPDTNTDGKTNSVEASTWKESNATVIAWIKSVIDPKLHSILPQTESAKVFWDELRARYGSVENSVRIQQLETLFSETKQGDMSKEECGAKMRRIQDELETVKWLVENTRSCPKCRKTCWKNGGCSLLICVCGQAFCWPCGAATGKEHGHGGIVGHTCSARQVSNNAGNRYDNDDRDGEYIDDSGGEASDDDASGDGSDDDGEDSSDESDDDDMENDDHITN